MGLATVIIKAAGKTVTACLFSEYGKGRGS
ncbi:uncharacterized protein METZ01_LOCUS211814 [marine metagenome]|uniref:Uncharacterized protein n=1 Tax=marine metagenome TaxID=408172 RepID=A0A382F7M8_9ZZZZ